MNSEPPSARHRAWYDRWLFSGSPRYRRWRERLIPAQIVLWLVGTVAYSRWSESASDKLFESIGWPTFLLAFPFLLGFLFLPLLVPLALDLFAYLIAKHLDETESRRGPES